MARIKPKFFGALKPCPSGHLLVQPYCRRVSIEPFKQLAVVEGERRELSGAARTRFRFRRQLLRG